MKTIGIIGGMSWESTVTYYQLINRLTNEKLGGLHSAKCILSSVDFHEIEQLQARGEWEQAGEILSNEAIKLEQAGAACILLATNTMHQVADQIEQNTRIPLLHIADAVAEEAKSHNFSRVGLLGTKYTMKLDFFKDRLQSQDVETILPKDEHMEELNRVIFEELVFGKTTDSSRKYYLEAMEQLKQNGAEAIVLGCTEIGLLIQEKDFSLPLIDTVTVHAEKAVNWATTN